MAFGTGVRPAATIVEVPPSESVTFGRFPGFSCWRTRRVERNAESMMAHVRRSDTFSTGTRYVASPRMALANLSVDVYANHRRQLSIAAYAFSL